MALIFTSRSSIPADLPDAIKAAIARLQIPTAQAAPSSIRRCSPTTKHPVRLLINRMARAAIGLARNTGCEHPDLRAA
jgi:hypothetical protein